MIETTARRDHRTVSASIRLDRLVGQTGTEPAPKTSAPPVEESWLDMAPDDPFPLLEPPSWLTDAPSTEYPATARSPGARREPSTSEPPRRGVPAGGMSPGDTPLDPPPAGPVTTGLSPTDPSGGSPPATTTGESLTGGLPPAGSSAGTQPSDEPPAGGTPISASPADSPPTTDQSAGGLLTAGWPIAEPWWRRHARRLFQRWMPDRRTEPPRWRLAVLAAGGVLLGVAVAVGFTLSGTREQPEIPPALPAASVSEVRGSSASTAAGTDGSIVISVVGRVATPGLVTLSDGARVADALEAAGGPAPGVKLGSLNLARRLTDGEQIYVGVPTPPGAEPPAATPGSGQPGAARVDLNSASLTALDTLPGVGPVTAQRILDWRTQHGRFASVEQLREVEGIGPARFAKLKDLVVAG